MEKKENVVKWGSCKKNAQILFILILIIIIILLLLLVLLVLLLLFSFLHTFFEYLVEQKEKCLEKHTKGYTSIMVPIKDKWYSSITVG
jgi:flagellar basal body-associated protein FliL